MIDVVTRDGAARRVLWKPKEGVEVSTPLLLYVDAPRFPAPAHARFVLSERKPARDVPWAQDRGSRFAPRERDASALIAFAPDLPYAPAAGNELAAAGESETRAALGSDALVLVSPASPLPEGEIVALGSARALVENPYELAKHLTAAREAAGFSRLLYAPGCGRPDEIALLAYAGVDVFDTAPALLAASRGELLAPEGGASVKSLAEAKLPVPARSELVAANVAAVEREILAVERAISLGKLRDLVEQRVRARPELVAHLRRFDKERFDFFEAREPIARSGALLATSKESIERVAIERYRRRIETRYAKPDSARILLVLPCSARKPYSDSRTHRVLATVLERTRNLPAVHEVILTSPMGVVPRELELVYPNAHYDLPVTGHWDEDEKAMIRESMTALVARSKYDRVIVHLEEVEMDIVAPVLGDFTYTVEGEPLAPKSLEQLRLALDEATRAVHEVRWPTRTADDLESIARWQFGERGATALAEGASPRGKWPFLKLVDGASQEQLAMMTPERGLLSLSLAGGKRLLEAGCYRVEIDDFRPKGTVFAVGVRGADAEVREGDDVVLHHAGTIKGVGRALMSGAEMVESKRGHAVAVRHYV